MQGEASELLLRKALEATTVSRRLFSFHAAFLNMVACPPGSSIEQVGDRPMCYRDLAVR
jgi:hypothetical protein